MTGRKIPPEDDYLAVGEIKGPYGVNGAVWVSPFSARAAKYPKFENVLLTRESESAPAKITSLKPVGGRWIATLAGTTSRDDAENLRGWLISIPKGDIAPLPEGTYYVHDLIGRRVFAEDGRFLGEITNIFPTGTNDVYAIDGPEGELLFPALRELVADCPAGGDTMRVRIPPGLLETCLTKRG